MTYRVQRSRFVRCFSVGCLLTILWAGDLVADEISFRRDVMPILFRAGCNSGTCHGSARGKDGFMLSLFGYDASGDYERVVNEITGRRVNPAVPEQSLLLLKATGAVPHSGGKLFSKDSEYYQALLQWIAAGALDVAETEAFSSRTTLACGA